MPVKSKLQRWSLVAALFALLSVTGVAQKLEPSHIEQLKFRHIGPVGNRLVSVVGIPGNHLVYYGGAASGGVWKTEDGGIVWKPIFDKQPVHSIGALDVSLSDPQVVWAGTGEAFIRSNVSVGSGVWKSTDGGANWQHMGLDNTFRISRVIIHPTNPDVVYVASLGHAYGTQKERGIFRTTDGGKNWSQVLFVNDSTGSSDLLMDPNNPRILFAGMWQLDIKTWGRKSGGKGSGIYMSRDGGDTWKRLSGNGLPKQHVGKISLTMSKSNSKIVYALIETADGVPQNGAKEADSGELWRSADGGESWTCVSHDLDLTGRGAYYTRTRANTQDADELYFMAAAFSYSTNGGRSTIQTQGQMTPNWDHHDMWIDPTNGDHMAVAGDGGIAISYNRGKSWHRSQLPVAQLYHVTTDNNIPYNVYTNRQDGPSSVGPSRAFLDDFMEPGIPRGMWHGVGGGESGFATPDPVDPNIVWSSASGSGGGGGIMVRYNEQKKQYRNVEVWPEATFGSPAKDVKYRFQWTFPVLISPHDHNTVYTTGNHVFRTTNGGQKWDVISPDLTTNDKSKQQISGGLTPDNIGVEYCCVIYAFDESPIQKGLLWAGTNDGLVHISKDGGANWENLTANIKGLPPHGTVRNIDASKYKAGKAYMTVDFHQVGNFDTHVYKTEDFGKTWTKITNGVPKGNVSYACNVREDPVRAGLLYLGTESALYVSFDDGANWQSMMGNLPPSPMYWINIQENFNDMVIGTYGRGIWILDDISPYQQLTPEVAASAAHLFAPNKTYRLHPITAQYAPSDDPSVGFNPTYGAPINYWLSADAKDSAAFEIRDAGKNLVRTIKHKGKAGINRVYWNLREDPSNPFYVRTKPLFADWVNLGDGRKRSAPSLGGQGLSPLVRPGDYTITMKIDGKEQTQPIKVLKDPNTEGTEADVQAQYALIADIKKDINSAATVVNQIELIRRQIYDIKSLISGDKGTEEVIKAIDATDAKLIEIEGNLIQLKITGDGQSSIRWTMQAVEKLGYLGAVVETADFPPADQHKEVYQILKARVADSQQKMAAFLEKDMPAFLETLKKGGYSSPVIIKK